MRTEVLRRYFSLLVFTVLLASCADHAPLHRLETIEEVIDTDPETAYYMLDSIDHSTLHGEARALYALLATQADYQCYVPLTSDSLIRLAADYYDGHTPHRRAALAHYYLGCTYTELGDAEALTAEIGEDSIHITGYYLSNCGMGLYCVAEEHGGSIALTFYEVGVVGADCVGYHPVDFSIPRLAEQVNEIYACDSYDQSIRLEAKIIDTSVGHISTPAVDAPYYDLQGRPVAHPTRGVYIRNGKKVIL